MSVANISPAAGRFHCAEGTQSYRLTRGARRVYRTKHKPGAKSAARARYFVRA